MFLSIIICTYKRPDLLRNCLSGAMQVLDKIDSEVIVINDSKDGKVIVPAHPRIKLFDNPKQGLASARNLGASKATGELILFVDDDIEFNLDNVKALIKLFENASPACYNPNWKYSEEMFEIVRKTQFGRFLIESKLVNYKGWVPELNWSDKVFEVKKLAGFFMLVPKNIFDKIHGFNETFIHQGTEDDELCKRFKEAGIKMFIDPDNYVYHNELDRISLETRLTRYYNGAINRRRAFELGHAEYEIKYSVLRRTICKLLLPLKKLIILSTKMIPNIKALDFFYFKAAHVLIALAIFEGYHSSAK